MLISLTIVSLFMLLVKSGFELVIIIIYGEVSCFFDSWVEDHLEFTIDLWKPIKEIK